MDKDCGQYKEMDEQREEKGIEREEERREERKEGEREGERDRKVITIQVDESYFMFILILSLLTSSVRFSLESKEEIRKSFGPLRLHGVIRWLIFKPRIRTSTPGKFKA